MHVYISRFRFPVLYLLITAAAGVVLRWIALLPSSWHTGYEPLLHAHSHIALLGWGYTAMILLLASRFLTIEQLESRFFRLNWLLTQITVILMFIAFSIQGYGFYSILFSTLHIFLSYSLGVWMWRRIPRATRHGFLSVSARFAKASLFFMMLSSAGPWTLAVINARQLTESPWYNAAIYFYLHCQYNGWFTLGLFAVLYSVLEQRKLLPACRLARFHYHLYTVTLLPSFLLSLLWMKLSAGWVAAAIVSGFLQLVSIAAFFILWHSIRDQLRRFFTGWSRHFLNLSMFSLAVKTVLELGSAIPILEPLVFSTRSVVIGYLHLVLLGFVSCMILSLAFQMQWLSDKGTRSITGCVLFVVGFTGNELILFLDGFLQWTYSISLPLGRELLLLASVLLLSGVIALFRSCKN